MGAAWILFRKELSQAEIINDINTDLVTLYRVVQHHLEEFIRYFKWALISREEFLRYQEENPDSLTDIQRAVRFYYLMRLSHGAKVAGQNFGVSTTGGPRLNLLRIEEELSAAHLRLARVVVENKPYSKFIERYDRPHTFFYLDPPYFGCEDDYGKGIFGRKDFSMLAEQLRGIEGQFILSINDRPEIRDIFEGFHVREVKTRYSVDRSIRGCEVQELLFMNFEP